MIVFYSNTQFQRTLVMIWSFVYLIIKHINRKVYFFWFIAKRKQFMIAFKLWHVFNITFSHNLTVHINNVIFIQHLYCAKAQRQQHGLSVAKAKR